MSTKLIVADHAKLNVFELDESRTYSYEIRSLGRGHNGMVLRVHDDVDGLKDTFGIGFLHVLYVDAPTAWKGGIFRTATRSECNKLRDILGIYRPKETPDPYLGYDVDDCALFEAVTPSGKFVRILASHGVEIFSNWKVS